MGQDVKNNIRRIEAMMVMDAANPSMVMQLVFPILCF
jgi:hypothetical protein